MNVLIIGGSRFVGPLLIDSLLQRDHQLTIFNRGNFKTDYPKSVRVIRGDRNNGFEIKETFDAVIDMCAYNGRHTQTALDQLTCDYFLHFGSVASYKETSMFPLTEESTTGYWPFMGNYSRGKVECEEVLAASGRKYSTIRPTYVLGSHNYLDRESLIYRHIRAGRPLVLPGNGQAVVQFVTAQDVADIIVLLVEKQLTGAYNCAGDEMITLQGLVEQMAAIVGRRPVIQYNPAADRSNLNEDEFPFSNENLIVSNQKIRDLGFIPTPLLDGLKQDYELYYKGLLA